MKNMLLLLQNTQENMQDVLNSTKVIYFVLLSAIDYDIRCATLNINDISEKVYWKAKDEIESEYLGKSTQEIADMVYAAESFKDLDGIFEIINNYMFEFAERLATGYFK